MAFFDVFGKETTVPIDAAASVDTAPPIEKPVRVITLAVIQQAGIRCGMEPDEIDAKIEAVFVAMDE